MAPPISFEAVRLNYEQHEVTAAQIERVIRDMIRRDGKHVWVASDIDRRRSATTGR